MAKVVTRIAAHLTKEHHCGDGTSYKYDLDAHVSASFEKMPPGKACGLSGFSPLTSFEKDAVWQRVAGELDDTWSCVAVRSDGNPLGGPSEEDSLNEGTTLSAFTVTSNRRYLEGFKKSHGRTYADEEEGTRSKVMRCGGEEYLLQVMYPGSESDQDAIRKYSEKHQAGPDSLVKRFEGSVRRALKCEK
ncbi:hypothetical protein [Streptomyces qinglanensis]|uniref:Uncharacterized protein n=1 Tax=Streptomyces qinglanensis TaxID=943816 RepID=A0A1H9NGP5_9ACTN|nr:hypothetical protein [Streptomyces qinglanensis]SER34947.1 hypothetical protein SAMN05421870_101370 [Streptomyces qinglanensis]